VEHSFYTEIKQNKKADLLKKNNLWPLDGSTPAKKMRKYGLERLLKTHSNWSVYFCNDVYNLMLSKTAEPQTITVRMAQFIVGEEGGKDLRTYIESIQRLAAASGIGLHQEAGDWAFMKLHRHLSLVSVETVQLFMAMQL